MTLLVIPRPGFNNQRNFWPLKWDARRKLLLDPTGVPFDGVTFIALRALLGAWIQTDNPNRVAKALGLGEPDDHSGIGLPANEP